MAASTATPTETQASCAVVHVERREENSVISELRGVAPLALRPLADAGGWSRVAIVQSSACLLPGDAVGLRVIVGAQARLELLEISATLSHPCLRQRAIRQSTHVTLMTGAQLVFREQPLIMAAETLLTRVVVIELSEGACCLHGDSVILGRDGEQPGPGTIRTRVERAGRPVLDDTLATVDRAALRSKAVVGAARCVATAGLWGATLSDPLPPGAFKVGREDTLLRSIGLDAPSALSPIDALWPLWRRVANDSQTAARRVLPSVPD